MTESGIQTAHNRVTIFPAWLASSSQMAGKLAAWYTEFKNTTGGLKAVKAV